MKTRLIVLPPLLFVALAIAADEVSPIGYSDTPVIPGSKWRVHDIARPAPTVVQPGAKLGDAPSDAIVLFNGKDTSQLYSRRKDDPKKYPCAWKIDNEELIVDGGDSWTNQDFSSCQLHMEWKSAAMGQKGNSQKKGNGGVFFMDRYESQILDSYSNPSYADGITGAVYGQTPPLVNAVHKPGEWQTYDIVFTAPKVKNGKVVEPARITTFVNGVCVQNGTAIMGPTMHKKTTEYRGDFPARAPFRFQDHKNEPPIRMRNIWVRPLPDPIAE